MSDLEIFKTMLKRSGVGFREERDTDQVYLWFETGAANVSGYTGFSAIFSFDATTGALAGVEVGE